MDQTDNTKIPSDTTPSQNTITYGNLEVTIEGISDKQLDDLLDTIIEKVESFGLEMVARTYKTTDTDDEDGAVKDTKEPPTTKEG